MSKIFPLKPVCLVLVTLFTTGSFLFAQPDFTADVLSGCNPLVVNFTSNVPGASSVSWDLGNNTFSSQFNPGVTYVTPGIFDVSMTANYPDGSAQTITKSAYIEVFQNPQPDFSANVTNICEGESIVFSDLSQAGSSPITNWLWDFGDGVTMQTQHPVHQFQTAGTFAITLVTTDANACEATEQKLSYIQVNETPSASFVADNALGCSTPFPVNFFSTGAGASVTHSWNFGNGNTGSGVNPSQTYQNNGSYTVSHIVTDPIGCSDTVIKPNFINVGSSSVNVQVSSSSVCPGDNVNFFCGSSFGSIVFWDFGVPGATANTCNASYIYNSPGNYNVLATIIDTAGCNFSANLQITVNPAPIADFTVTDTILCESPMTTSFINNSSGANSYQWAFGDGSSSAATNPTHTYPTLPIFSATGQPYEYDVTLIATNASGCSSTLTRPDAVTSGQTRSVINANVRQGCAPLDVQFTGFGVTTSNVIGWQWDFGDGSAGSNLQNPQHTYTDTGYFDVTLIITTLHGCTDTLTHNGYIKTGEKPIADFDADTTYACAERLIAFTNLSQHADSASWFFGDDGVSRDWEPTYTYTDSGYMDVILIALDRGCPDTVVKDSFLYIDPPIAQFQPSPAFGCELPYTVDFEDFSIGAHRYEWDFGDGSPDSTSSLSNPSHTYTEEGTFIVTLTVYNDSTACQYTTTGVVIIELVEAAFSVDTTLGCVPLVTIFSDSSTNAIAWNWDFGDGWSSNSDKPVHTYQQAGQYTVSLTVQNSLTCSDTETKSQLITANGVTTDFAVSDPSICAPTTVNFNNLTVSQGPISHWQWAFGPPGATSNQASPSYTYISPGPYTVSLTAIDDIGCTDTEVKSSYIFVSQPIPGFYVDHPNNCANNPIPFINTSIGAGLSYFWEFGDGNTSTAANPVHTYTANGIYDVRLTITDFQGCDSTIFFPGYISIANPVVDFVADTTSSDCPPLLVNFTATAFSNHGFNSWQWDFGDSTSSIGQNPSHIYTSSGNFDVSLTATAPSGCQATVQKPDLINISGPTGSFTFAPQQVCPGIPITFIGSGSGNIVKYTWDFNNGVLGNGQTVAYAYPNSGVYHPLLIMEDSTGCEVVIQVPDSVVIFPKPQAQFAVVNGSLCDSGLVSFTNQSASQSPIISYNWDFGVPGGTSTQPNPSFFFSAPGSYDVSLWIESSDGCRDTIMQAAAVQLNTSPVVAISVSDSSGCSPLTVDFADISPPGNASVQSWDWNFGVLPTATSTQQNPSFSYNSDGNFNARLTITDVNGCAGTANQLIEVFPLPQAQFTQDDSTGCAVKSVQFTNLTPLTVDWQWDFGDGTPAVFDENPLHTYQNDGVYSVSLQVWDANGCTGTLAKPQLIVLDHPEANFSVSDRIVCPGTDILFTDLSNSDTLISSWLWDFGDGTGTSTQQNPSYSYTTQGIYDIQLTVADVFGCSDEIIMPAHIEVLLDEIPEGPDIRYVSVLSDTEVELAFSPYPNTRDDFREYVIYRADAIGNWNPIQTITNINQTSFRDQGLDARQQSYCYRIQVVNYCGSASSLDDSETHCSILLNTTPLLDAIELNWTAYQGWNQLAEYRIYRVRNYQMNSATLVATVAGNVLQWMDTDMFCYEAVTYRVEAVEQSGGEISLSNIRRDFPQHFGPTESLHMAVATVEQDSFVVIEWDDMPPEEDLVEVIVEKEERNGFVEIYRQSANDLNRTFEDLQTDVHQQSYTYRAFVVDSCGDVTPPGRIARSIYLKAQRQRGKALLSWNDYESWGFGVARYVIEVFNDNSLQFEVVDEVPGNVLEFVDDQTELPQLEYCYRIVAYESGGNGLSSISNESCVLIEPQIFYPNAFTPNHDLVNDEFLIKGIFLEQYSILIFNRWGEKIFESSNIDQAWDGTYQGKPVPEGVYVFQVNGVGHNGNPVHKTGTVTLIR